MGADFFFFSEKKCMQVPRCPMKMTVDASVKYLFVCETAFIFLFVFYPQHYYSEMFDAAVRASAVIHRLTWMNFSSKSSALKSLLACSQNRSQKPRLFFPLSSFLHVAALCVTYKARSAVETCYPPRHFHAWVAKHPLSSHPASQPTSQGGINMENKSTQTFSPPLPRLRPGEDDKLGEEIKQELVKWRQRRGWDYLETRPGVLAVLRVTAAASVQRARPPNRTCRAPGRNTDWLPGGPETTRPGWRL